MELPNLTADALKTFVRDIPDFPKPGILFKDITPLLAHGPAFHSAIRLLADAVAPLQADTVAAVEARGFLIAAPLAMTLGLGLVPIRKPGKLPYATLTQEYQLEYGTDRLEIHTDALTKGRRILLVDDVLATGGTMRACCNLVQSTGAIITGCAFLLELGFLNGRSRFGNIPLTSLLTY